MCSPCNRATSACSADTIAGQLARAAFSRAVLREEWAEYTPTAAEITNPTIATISAQDSPGTGEDSS